MGSHTLPKSERIRKKSEYQATRNAGKRVHTPHFIVNYLATDSSSLRMGMAVGIRVGNSVKRNRVKRCLREFFRLNKPHIRALLCNEEAGMDLVFIAKPGAYSLSFDALSGELVAGIKKLARRLPASG